MGIKDLFKKEDNLTKELRMLPRDTKRRILEKVTKRRNEILEEKLLEKQLKQYDLNSEPQKRKWATFKEGMQNRRKELKEKGILKPPIRYNQENFKSPIEDMSRKAREAEIKGYEDQRNKMKSGHTFGMGNGLSGDGKIKLKELKLKVPEDKVFKLKKGVKKNGFI